MLYGSDPFLLYRLNRRSIRVLKIYVLVIRKHELEKAHWDDVVEDEKKKNESKSQGDYRTAKYSHAEGKTSKKWDKRSHWSESFSEILMSGWSATSNL